MIDQCKPDRPLVNRPPRKSRHTPFVSKRAVEFTSRFVRAHNLFLHPMAGMGTVTNREFKHILAQKREFKSVVAQVLQCSS